MNDGDRLLAAILDDPESDAPRLIYADWLEEHGQGELAEFIRVQCELATKLECPDWCDRDPAKCRTTWLEHRQHELWRLDGSKIAADMPSMAHAILPGCVISAGLGTIHYRATFRRGFAEQFVGSFSSWEDFGPAIVRRHPIQPHAGMVTDREPIPTRRGFFYWQCEIENHAAESFAALIPAEIFRHLQFKQHPGWIAHEGRHARSGHSPNPVGEVIIPSQTIR
jgi:uncharacterized protein (TIGR02996 family)